MLVLPETMFHFADAANADSILQYGLLSTNALIHSRILDPTTLARVTAFRPVDVELPTGERVRNQSPMPPSALQKCLDPGLTPEDWYHLVNGHVFFWLDAERMRRHAYALRTRAQLLLTVDTASLLARYDSRAYVTPFNIGNARRAAAKRGTRTLCPVASWRQHGWLHETAAGGRQRPLSHPPAELLVAGSVPDIQAFVIESTILAPW